MSQAPAKQENSLANILINVLIPVMILSFLSKDPALQEKLGKAVRPWHIGPVYSMAIALALPLGYGIWHFIKSRKANFFSGLGMVSILLTGGLTLYLWNQDGSVKPNAGMLFGLKEACIPLVLGIAILCSGKSKSPLLNTFLYNDGLFDIRKIEATIAARNNQLAYANLLKRATVMFSCSFFTSSVMNLCLALWFFRGFDHQAIDALEKYNQIVGKLTGWGFAVIGVPILIFFFLILRYLLKGLHILTGMKDDELMLPR